MNVTEAIVFIDTLGEHEAVLVYEQSDIDDYRNDCSWLELGTVLYDTVNNEIIAKYKMV